MSSQDERFMAAALRLGRRGLGQTAPNPSVGCLIVQGEGEDAIIVGAGVTARGGRPHAEVLALAQAGKAAKGATAYVTLEPCAHQGETPPCSEALIMSGIKRVVCAMRDPDTRVSGKGIEKLKQAGLAVMEGIGVSEAARDHIGHSLRMRLQRPFIQMKMALTANNIAGRKGQRLMISGNEGQIFAHRLRSMGDAILVGSNTVLNDDPLLTCRLPGLEHRSPHRFVIDRHLRIPLEARLVATAKEVPTTFFTLPAADPMKRSAMEAAGVAIHVLPGETDNILTQILRSMAALGLTRVLLEGGPSLTEKLLALDFVDEAILTQNSSSYEGPDGIAGLSAKQRERIFSSPVFLKCDEAMLGSDHMSRFWRAGRCLPA